jgi:Spy/CpxP family protein refolding chaperone
MADDKDQTAADRQRISIDEDYEHRDWPESLGTTEEKLREAVQAVGNSADKVRQHLRSPSTSR